MKRLQKLPSQLFMAFSVLLVVLFSLAPTVEADYNSSDLISDTVFTYSSSMSASDIQNFLASENGGLTNYMDFENCGSPSGAHYSYYTTYYKCGQYVPASQIIYDASQAYGINPRVILATLEKEQSLVTDPNPTQSQINCAMGYNSCNSYVGFFNQVDNGTWQFRMDYETSTGSTWWGYGPSAYPCSTATNLYSTGLYAGNTVTFFDPGGTAETITLADASTAVLYCYTPYVGPISVTGYSGSYNFVMWFDEWWGSTTDACVNAPMASLNPQPHNPLINGDYSDDGETAPAIYDPSDNCWHMRGVGDFGYGDSGDIPVPGNYGGDGTTDAAVYDPSNGMWHIRGVGDFQYGEPGDIPVPGYYGYGGPDVEDIAVYDPSNGMWHIRGVGDFQYGEPGDIPVPGDYNGSGFDGIAVYDPSNGMWHIRGVGDFQYGEPGDIPVPGYYGYQGTSIEGMAVYRPSDGSWHIRGVGDFQYGEPGDIPVPGYYGYQGTSIEGMAVYRPSDGGWYTRGVGDYAYGSSTDIPVAATLNAYLLSQYGLIGSY